MKEIENSLGQDIYSFYDEEEELAEEKDRRLI
jgi:hypothetical protein